MKRILRSLALAFVAVMLLAIPVLASDISDATYEGTINIVNTSTAATNVSVPFTLSTAALISSGYLNSYASDSAIRIDNVDVAYMPAPTGTTDWSLFVASSPHGTKSAKLYVGGGTDMAAKIRYFPGAGGMSAADTAMELGNNFIIEQKGRVDTAAGASKYLVYKQDALTVEAASGNVTATVIGSTQQTAQDINSSTIHSASRVRAGQRINSFPATTITQVSFYALKVGAPVGNATVRLRKVSDDSIIVTLGTIDVATFGLAYAWYDLTGSWANPAAQDVRLSFEYAGGDGGNYVLLGAWNADVVAGQMYSDFIAAWTDSAAIDLTYKIYYGNSISTAVASGEHTIKLYTGGGNIILAVDGVDKVNMPVGAGVPDNGNTWYFLQNNSMPYMEFHKITTGGVLRQHIIWLNNSAVFADQAPGAGNPATPTFRTTSSDGDVSASLVTFTPVAQADASAPVAPGEDLIDSLPPEPANMYDEGETGGMIIDDLVNPSLATAGIPEAVFWYPIAFVIAIVLGFAAYGWTKQLVVQAIVSGVVMAMFCGGGVLGDGLIPYWTVIIFAVEAFLLIAIHERQST